MSDPKDSKADPLAFPEFVTLSRPQPLWTVKEVAERLQVSTDYIYAAASRGEIPCVRLGTSLRFHYSDVVTFLNRLRTLPKER
ncbi:MAG: helix-turn-helix domain-containing protein [Anaeromyxobacter sp.]